MALATASLRPLAPQQFGYAQARHLLNRAGWGGTPQQIVALQMMGLDAAVDYLVDYESIDETVPNPTYDPNILRPYTPEEQEMLRVARERGDQATIDRLREKRLAMEREDARQMGDLRRWWLGRIIRSPRPLEDKLTLLWHGHFASNYRTVENSFMMLQQNVMLRRHAKDSFAKAAASIIRDPAMIKFLNNDSNRKGRPNENLARELMELFTLGEGNYTENDIKEGARALTGYGIEGNNFRFYRDRHDDGYKQILGQRGNFNGDDFVNLCLQRRSCGEFICLKLYRHFVGDLPDGPDAPARSVITNLARQLVRDKYRLGGVLKTLFRSEHFYDPAIMGNMIKSPTQLVAGIVRTLDTPVRDIGALVDAMDMMGQRLFDPPSVKGWNGGRAWINTSTLFIRQNLATYLITGKSSYDRGWSRHHLNYDPSFLIEGMPIRTPSAVVEHLCATLLGEQLHPQRREQLTAFLEARGGKLNRDTIIALLLLMTAMPEFQLC